jgi:hypothetical protein
MLSYHGVLAPASSWRPEIIPPTPALEYRGFHLQAVLATGTGLELTNDLSVTILP